MKAHVLGSVLALMALAACHQPANHIPEGVAQVFDLRTGDELTVLQAAKADGFYGTITEPGQFIAFVRYNPDAFQTTLVHADGEQADSTSALCLGCDAFAGINGSYFNMQELTPVTFIKDDGFVISGTEGKMMERAGGAVVLNPEEIRIDACDSTSTFETDWEVMVAGPILLDDGQVIANDKDASFNATRHPRSLIGKDAAGGVWMVVVDGRFPGEAEGMSIAELTELAQRLGLTEALNLDGGGSSTLWVLPAGVLNHPCDNRQFDHEGQRIVPNAIVAR